MEDLNQWSEETDKQLLDQITVCFQKHEHLTRSNMSYVKKKSCWSKYTVSFKCLSSVWRFPKMGVPLNHPFIDRFSVKKTIQLLGYPHLTLARRNTQATGISIKLMDQVAANQTSCAVGQGKASLTWA